MNNLVQLSKTHLSTRIKHSLIKATLATCLILIGFETNASAVTTSPKNSLTTATLTTSDINNKAEYSASSKYKGSGIGNNPSGY